ncbi:MAG: SDR family oxidoreductase [Clostridia bacterium]|jgi:enoyl-[acyl-carrier protein] reductase I|nr:SDR family oxidoreductase [Clostridia bacterium]
MILSGKTILIMGIRNKWSIAWGAAMSAYENGAKVIFTHHPSEKEEKIQELIEQIPGSKSYACDAASDEDIKKCLETIKKEHGKVDGILHSIAHANTEDLRNDFIFTSREGFSHANDISAYSLVAITRIAKEIEFLTQGASIVALTYFGSEKVVEGYNLMGIAKAALETSIKYLAKDIGKDKIRINAISAGPIKTLSAKGIKDFGTILELVEQKAPLHQNVTTKQVGDVASFLFSNLSSAITGEVIHADNGFSTVGV